MRDTAGLNRVFDRSLFPKLPDNVALAALWPNEEWQITVKVKPELEWLAIPACLHGLTNPE
jgi:hypothetical protein